MELRIRKRNYCTKIWDSVKDNTPAIKRQPVYEFLRKTANKTDTEKQRIKALTMSIIYNFFENQDGSKIRYIGLPGITWDFERRLNTKVSIASKKRLRISITGCENDYKVFCLSAAKIPGNENHTLNSFYSDKLGHYVIQNSNKQFYLINADIFSIINTNRENTRAEGKKFNCIWLDTTHTVISVVNRLGNLNNAIEDTAMLIITMLKGREHNLKIDRIDYLSNALSPFSFKLLKRFEYFDSCAMIHLIYTRK